MFRVLFAIHAYEAFTGRVAGAPSFLLCTVGVYHGVRVRVKCRRAAYRLFITDIAQLVGYPVGAHARNAY